MAREMNFGGKRRERRSADLQDLGFDTAKKGVALLGEVDVDGNEECVRFIRVGPKNFNSDQTFVSDKERKNGPSRLFGPNKIKKKVSCI